MEGIPPRLTIVTLGVRQMSTLRAFYTGLGWPEQPGASDQHCMYLLGGTLLALYPTADLAAEAAPGEPLTKPSWGGHIFAPHVAARDPVTEVGPARVAEGGHKDRPGGD